MHQIEFKTQIDRLNKTFNGFYNEERTKIVWQELQSMSEQAMKRIVDTALVRFRTAPTVEDLFKLASEVRAQLYSKTKEEYKSEAKDFWAGTFHADDVKLMVGWIKDRISGNITEEQFQELKKMIKETKPNPSS